MISIDLKWIGPVNFLTGEGIPKKNDTKTLTGLAGPGIYLWIYPKKTYKKAGIYVGKSKNLIRRHFQHLGYWLNGHYCLIDRKSLAWRTIPEKTNPGYEDYIKDCWSEVTACKTFFAPTENEKLAFYAERAFIEAYQKVIENDNKNFFYKQGVQQTVPSPEAIKFKNKGAPFVREVFNEIVSWQP